MLNIGYIGNFEVPFTTENDVKWSLEQLGHTVLPYQENATNVEVITTDIVDGNIDLLLYTSTHGWVTPSIYGNVDIAHALRLAEENNIPTAGYHLDLWAGLDRQGDVGARPFWGCKYIFSADGGSQDFFKEKGINHFWLKAGVVKRDCYLGEYQAEFACDVAFVGSGDYAHAQWPYRKQLLDWLDETYGNRFMHIGRPNRTLRGRDLNNFYASAKVIVGDTLCIGFKHPNYWSDRVYETLGRGGFLIHPYIKGMEVEFTPGTDLVFYNYGDFDYLHYSIDYFLNHYEQRKHIQLNGHELVKGNCTYTDRMKELLFTIADYEPIFKAKLTGGDD